MRMGFSGARDHFYTYNNPMAGDEEEKSPLKKYQHLLPASSHSVNSLDQHLFLVNISILFPYEDASTLRFTVVRTTDRAINPNTNDTEQRDLYYAALVAIQPPSDESKTTTIRTTRTLAKGPAVPHFAPPPELIKQGGGLNHKMNSFSSTSARHVNEDKEIRDAKEKAMSLLMAKVEVMVHTELHGEDAVEVWDAKAWKYAESNVVKETEGSIRSGTGKNKQRISSSGWFSKA